MQPDPSSTSSAVRTTFCPLDCPDACSLAVTVEDGRAVAIDGDHRNLVTGGYICRKVRRFAERVYGPDRLLYPGLREGAKGEGRFRRVSWDEALDRLAAEIERVRAAHGAEAILPFCYGGSNGWLTQGTVDARLFYRLGASRLARTVCANTTSTVEKALYGRMVGIAPEDYAGARVILVWGFNAPTSSMHLVPYLRQAQKNGGKLVVVDPRATPLARQADLHLQLRPGTDLPVALAILRWLFENGAADLAFLAAHARGAEELRRRAAPWTLERAAAEAGVAADAIAEVARLYAALSPAAIRVGWGMERNRNGGSAAAAIFALPAVAGKFGQRGAGYTMTNSTGWDFDGDGAAGVTEPATRVINMNRLGRVLTEQWTPPVQLLYVYDCNPLMTMPDQHRVRRGLLRDDLFTVVHDQVMTDTARHADLVLPATTFLEHVDLKTGDGSVTLQETRPVIAPVGEALPNYEVFLALCRRLGLDRPGDPETPAELRAALLARNPRRAEFAAALDTQGIAQPIPAPVQFIDVFPGTPDGKIDLVPEDLDRGAPHGLYSYQEDPTTARFPLALISPGTKRTISSSLGELDRGRAALEIHPADAAARGIGDGDEARVYNELGALVCPVRVTSELRPGVVLLPKGMWSHHGDNGATGNALVPDSLSDVAEGACFNDARVEVERWPPSGRP
jgi:anaerobic selenocysteine-containing dehydrogenase